MKPYLILYNLISAVGWGYLLFLTIQSLLSGLSPSEFWTKVSYPLQIIQTLAVLEIFHVILRFVPSPLFSTVSQVASRLLLLWVYMTPFPSSHNHWSIYLVVASWSLVEVPRYLYYAVNLLTSKVPSPLFFLRYNLFMALYPTGIIGELIQIFKALPAIKQISLTYWYLSAFVILLYLPGAPFLYSHMIVQRKAATVKRITASRPIPKPDGIEFPLDKKGERSTMAIGQGAFAASAAAVDPKLAESVKATRNWRFGYARHVIKNVEKSCESPEICLKMAEAGLDYLHNTMEFIRDGKSYKLNEAMNKFTGSFETHIIKGNKAKPTKHDYVVPYKGNPLRNKELIAQLDKWVKYGTIEPEARSAIADVAVNHPEWLDLSDLYFVLLGAGSAMGPLLVLLSLGANVIAIDLDREMIWKRLIGLTRDSCGTLIFPVKKDPKGLTDDQIAKIAGSNLFSDTPEIKNWLLTVEKDKPLIIGGYAYLDGALFVKVAMAMDAIIKGIIDKRKHISLGFLCSPTDVFVIPEDSRKAMIESHKRAPLWQKIIASISGGRFLLPNATKQIKSADGKHTYAIVDGLVVAQGPNYALAKRLQHWRCMLAREQEGCVVSTNIAPSTSTSSVVSNVQFAAAYGGMHLFRPMEIMGQETSNAVMGAILVSDIRNKESVAHPSTKLSNPQELFSKGAFHGGIWRMGYKMNSIGEIAAVSYYLKIYRSYLFAVTAAIVGTIAYGFLAGPPHTWF